MTHKVGLLLVAGVWIMTMAVRVRRQAMRYDVCARPSSESLSNMR